MNPHLLLKSISQDLQWARGSRTKAEGRAGDSGTCRNAGVGGIRGARWASPECEAAANQSLFPLSEDGEGSLKAQEAAAVSYSLGSQHASSPRVPSLAEGTALILPSKHLKLGVN